MIDCDRVPVATPTQRIVAEVQLRLDMLGSRLAVDGAQGRLTTSALRAWEVRNGQRPNGSVSATDLRMLRAQTAGTWSVRVDKARQVMVVRRGARTVEIPVSTGATATPTPSGVFVIQRRIDGMRQSRLGCLQKPLYFTGGFAIHGSNSVPRRPASHGCVRVRMPAIEALFAALRNGTRVTIR